MINPVNNNINPNFNTQTSRRVDATTQGEKFSLNAAPQGSTSENAKADDGGVTLELSGKGASAFGGSDTYTPTSVIYEQSKASSTTEESETSNFLTNILSQVRRIFSGISKTIVGVFGAIWDSKPIGEAINNGLSEFTEKDVIEKSSPEKDNSEADNKITDINISEADSNTLNATATLISSEEMENVDIEPWEDDGKPIPAPMRFSTDEEIKAALKKRDHDTFRDLVTEGGKKAPARNSSLLTYYDKSGKYVEISPSDTHRILHGDKGMQKL